jgi:phosphate acetyltransferase
MHPVIANLRANAKKDPKRIVYPEIKDDRILAAYDIVKKEKIAEPYLLTKDLYTDKKKDEYAELLYSLKKRKYQSVDEPRKLMDDPMYFSMMMVRSGDMDGVVTGAQYTSADVARSIFRCIETDTRCGIITSCFLMALPDAKHGEQGILIYADCGLIPDPTAEQLAGIGLASAYFVQDVLKYEPRIAFLSYSTKGSAEGPRIDKVRKAVAFAKAKAPDMKLDGELQGDSALVPEVAARKLKDSPVAGKANVLIFPDLDSGNISYKLTERLAGAQALGPLILGTVQPCSDLSRGCSPDDVVDCTAITVIKGQMRGVAK